MGKMKIFILSLLIISGAGLAGCCGSPGEGGKGGTAEVHVKKHTTGQELIDLQKAHESGAIDDEEYEKQKEAILEGKK
ncbi:MAG: hypothetical protein ISS63_05065 [Desulfobacteraceae bacterium]|nr:hypothetical protein [Desulfobacteraceae bacterium]